jgi:hypothetical protein
MAQCEVCGNDYDKAFQISLPGEDARTFDSFECAIHALAPTCEYCGVKVIGHGVEAGASFYCCAQYATMVGAEGSPAGRGHTKQPLVRGSGASMGLRGAGLLSHRS